MDLDLAERVPAVTGDPVALRRIVENLMRNAIEAVESGTGIVTVSTRSSGDSGSSGVRISVADTGSGMTEDELEKAFEDF